MLTTEQHTMSTSSAIPVASALSVIIPLASQMVLQMFTERIEEMPLGCQQQMRSPTTTVLPNAVCHILQMTRSSKETGVTHVLVSAHVYYTVACDLL